MKLESQVVNLELARRLRELGVKQESHFVWYENGANAHLLDCPDGMRPMEQKTYSAFTVAELGEMLTPYLEDIEGDGEPIPEGAPHPDRMGLLWEPNFLANLLIFLLENNLIPHVSHK